ncbi:MAG: ABC transporter permease [Prevotellaceae bacterium]|nr:ABC transporter permease [Prevotellaceae bacterium]
MNFANLLKVAFTAIMSNKSRTLLSTLGIIIGVAAVITMMAIGQGSKESIRAELSKMGTNLLTIRPGADRRGGVRLDPSEMQTLKVSDLEAIQEDASLARYISPEVTASGQVIYGGNNTLSTIYGESPEYLDIKLWTLKDGVCFTEEDIKKSAKVCVVGTTVVEELFGDKDFDAIGKTIRFKSIPFHIVGILKSKGYNSWGMDQDNVIIAPYTTVMKRIAAQTYFNSINVSALSEELSDDAIDELTEILRRTHKIKSGDEDNFQIRSQQEMMETMTSTMTTLQTVLVVAAAFSLLVAGIGIMNIMLVSVTERTKEIGLRMSVGARGIDISRQFLFESIVISLTGGVIGIVLGYILSWGANRIGFPATVPMWSVLVSFCVCALIGLVFGYIPARKAALMDPIEAIRYE